MIPKLLTIEVTATYTMTGYPELDAVADKVAGRPHDHSGTELSTRELGWTCANELEAERIKRALTKVGIAATKTRAPLTKSSRDPQPSPLSQKALRRNVSHHKAP